MKPLKYLTILLCLLLYSPVQAQEERQKYGKIWNAWTDSHREAYLLGFEDGMEEGVTDLERFIPFLELEGLELRQIEDFGSYSLTFNFPDIKLVMEVMSELYSDPANAYLEFTYVFLISVAKIRGSSPNVIDRLLLTARKESYGLYLIKRKTDVVEAINKLGQIEFDKEFFRDLIKQELYPRTKAK